MKLSNSIKRTINVVDALTNEKTLACVSFLKRFEDGKMLVPQDIYLIKDTYYRKKTFLQSFKCFLQCENKDNIGDTMWLYIPTKEGTSVKFGKNDILNW